MILVGSPVLSIVVHILMLLIIPADLVATAPAAIAGSVAGPETPS